MRLYFDLEFTLLNRYTTPISLAIITDGVESFYAEFNDFNKKDLTDWVDDNVISKLTFKNEIIGLFNYTVSRNITRVNEEHCGNMYYIHQRLLEWLDKTVPEDDQIEWVGDVAYFDFMLLNDILLGGKSVNNTTLKYPAKYGNPVYYDVNQAIATKKGISINDAFDLNRIVLVSELIESKLSKEFTRHDALSDAVVVRSLYYKFK